MKVEDAPEVAYGKWDYDGTIEVWFEGEQDEEYRRAINLGVEKLKAVLGDEIPSVLQGLKIIVADGLIESGAEAFPDERKIVLDKSKNRLSLKEAEEHVLEHTDYEVAPGEMSSLLDDPSAPFGSATVNIVHESAHIIDKLSPGDAYNRLDPKFSPTRYGRERGPHEAFADAFTHLAFGRLIAPEAERTIKEAIGNK